MQITEADLQANSLFLSTYHFQTSCLLARLIQDTCAYLLHYKHPMPHFLRNLALPPCSASLMPWKFSTAVMMLQAKSHGFSRGDASAAAAATSGGQYGGDVGSATAAAAASAFGGSAAAAASSSGRKLLSEPIMV